MKAAGWGFEEVDTSRVLLVSNDGEVLAGSGNRHIEYPIHTEVMRQRPYVAAVVHSHAAAGSRIRLARSPAPPCPLARGRVVSRTPTFRGFAKPEVLDPRTAELGAAVAEAIGDGPGCLIPHHGLVTVGVNAAEAVLRLWVALDRACHVQLLAIAAGGPATWSDAAEVRLKQQEIWTEGQIAAGFAYQTWSRDAGQLPDQRRASTTGVSNVWKDEAPSGSARRSDRAAGRGDL